MSLRWFNSVIYIAFVIVVLSNFHINGEDEAEKQLSNIQKLKNKLFSNYDAETRPVVHHSNTTTVYFNVVPLAVVELVEELSLLHIDAWLFLSWHDYRLAWNQSEYDGLEFIQVKDHYIWQPDITVYNGHSGFIDPKINTHLLIYAEGHVIFVPPAILVSRCPIVPQGSYPEDIIVCEIHFGSWSHDGWQIDLQTNHEDMYMDEFENSNPMWELVVEDSKIFRQVRYYNCCEEPYVSVKANFPLKRRPPPELQVIWAPCVLTMALTLTMFWIPPHSNKKIILGAFLFLALCLLTIYVAAVTKSPTSIKRAVTFLESTLYALTSAIILEIMVINLCRITGPCRPPDFLIRLLTNPMTRYLAVWAPWEANVPVDKVQLKEDTEQPIRHPTPNEEWILVATGLDRLLFFLYIIILAAIHQI